MKWWGKTVEYYFIRKFISKNRGHVIPITSLYSHYPQNLYA